MRLPVVFVVAVSLASAGCPGDDDSGDGTPLTVDELPNAFRSAYCRYLVSCGLFPDRVSCLSANLPPPADGFSLDLDPNLVAAIKAGRAELDVTRIMACLTTLAGMSCDTTDRDGRTLYRQCHRYVRGTLAAGATCFLDDECISQHCEAGATMETCVPGTCVGDTPPATEPAAIGEPCTSFEGCTDDAYCNYNDTFTCVSLHRAGEPCAGFEECDYGLACIGGVPGARSCEPLPTLGQPCPQGECRDAGTYCADSGSCEATGLAGASCTGAVLECAPAYPCDDSTRTCARGPGIGEPCAETSIVRCFDAGLVCDSASFTCVAPKNNGEPCTTDVVCKSERCDFTTGTCAPAVICQ